MVKDVDLTSQEWCEMIFEGKNKKYGAYYLRKTSGRRHLRAIIIVAIMMACFIAIPFVVKFIDEMTPAPEAIEEGVKMTNVVVDEPEDKPEDDKTPPPPPVEEPPAVQATQAYVVPEIVPRDQVPPDQQIRTMDDIKEDSTAIGRKKVEGTPGGAAHPDDIDTGGAGKQEPTDEGPKPIPTYLEVMPEFPGGQGELKRFLASNLVYPGSAIDAGIEGTVTLSFVINAAGEISDIRVVRSLTDACDKEAIRVVKKMPTWIPGKQNGKAMPVRYSLPIKYKLAAGQ